MHHLPFRSLLLTACACLYALIGHAQSPDDHLQPAAGYYTNGSPLLGPYYLKVQEVLYAGLSTAPLARVVTLPSFQVEDVISVDQKASKYYLTYQAAQKSIWHALQAKTNEKIVVNTQEIEITPEAATAIAALFNAALSQMRYPEPSMSMGKDGTTYTFITVKQWAGLRAGETWSPPAGTRMGRLVAVVESLRKATAQQQPLPAALLQEVAQLTAALRPQ